MPSTPTGPPPGPRSTIAWDWSARWTSTSSSLEVEVPSRLVLEVRARPLGRAQVTFALTSPTPGSTEVRFSEEPIGAARAMAPVAAALAQVRNTRSLQHLDRYLRERRG